MSSTIKITIIFSIFFVIYLLVHKIPEAGLIAFLIFYTIAIFGAIDTTPKRG